ncbi:hypothetical protein CD798_08330 [Bacillaceae bacterium SAOS 7]|nr:hypothetical protein CD798_08330 [Bacillaceae bacterium SAOS 7]
MSHTFIGFDPDKLKYPELAFLIGYVAKHCSNQSEKVVAGEVRRFDSKVDPSKLLFFSISLLFEDEFGDFHYRSLLVMKDQRVSICDSFSEFDMKVFVELKSLYEEHFRLKEVSSL